MSRRPKPIELETIIAQLTKSLETKRRLRAFIDSDILIMENLLADLGVDAGKTPAHPPSIETPTVERVKPATPAGAVVHRDAKPAKMIDDAIAHKPLKKGARAMLAVLRAFHPKPVTRAQLAIHAVLSMQTGTFTDYMSSLRTTDMIHAHPVSTHF